MSDATQPGQTPHTDTTQVGPSAVLLTADRFLVAYLAEPHPGVNAVTDTSDLRAHRLLAGATPSGLDGMLAVGDGLLVLADAATRRTVYMSGDL